MNSKRQPMSMASDEMGFKGFKGIGTVTRVDGENFIVVGRDARALAVFWKRWLPNFNPDKDKYRKTIVISHKSL